jgi:hypothetical protein
MISKKVTLGYRIGRKSRINYSMPPHQPKPYQLSKEVANVPLSDATNKASPLKNETNEKILSWYVVHGSVCWGARPWQIDD